MVAIGSENARRALWRQSDGNENCWPTAGHESLFVHYGLSLGEENKYKNMKNYL